jgi:hypothetical protein
MTSDQNFGVWGGRTETERRSGTDVNRRHGAQSDEKGQASLAALMGSGLRHSRLMSGS